MVTFLILSGIAALVILPLFLIVRLRELNESLQNMQARLVRLERVSPAPPPAHGLQPVPPLVAVSPPIPPSSTTVSAPNIVSSTSSLPVAELPPAPPSFATTPSANASRSIDELLGRPLATPPPPPVLPPSALTPSASTTSLPANPALPPPPPLTPVASSQPPPPPSPLNPLPGSTPVGHFSTARREPVFNWEQFLGVKLFAWLGGLALFLGAVLFIKLSIEEGWISPLVRIGGGYALGLTLITLGLALREKRYAVTAQTLCATGIVTLYAMTYSAWTYYNFFGASVTFGLMSVITVGAFALALWSRGAVIAVLGLLGGFLTPLLVNTGRADPIELFTYIGFLDTGLLAVALASSWQFLVPLAAVATILMEIAWGVRSTRRNIAETMALTAGIFDLLFVLGASAARFFKKWSPAYSVPVVILVTYSFVLAWILGVETSPPLTAQTWLELVVWSDLCALALLALGEKDFPINGYSGFVAFGLLATWTNYRLTDATLPWALVTYLAYALLHGLTPLALRRERPAFWATLLPFILLVVTATHLPMALPTGIFATALVLVFFAGAASFGWCANSMPLWALLGVGLVAETWQVKNFYHLDLSPPICWYAAFYALFTLYPFSSYKRFREQRLPWLTSALGGPVFFWLVYSLLTRAWPQEHLGWLPAIFAIAPALAAVGIAQMETIYHSLRLEKIAIYAGTAACFVALIFPIQFESEWMTSGWALEGVALLCLFQRWPHRGLAGLGVALLLIAAVKLALLPFLNANPIYATPGIFDRYFWTYGLAAVALLVAAQLARRAQLRWPSLNVVVTFSILAGILVFLLINLEISDYFDRGSPLRFTLTGEFARQMTVTVAWALYALTLLVVGIWRRNKGCRYASVGLLAITLFKLFFFDLPQLGRLYLIGALVGVAVVALVASFLYQRFVPNEESPAETPPPSP